jgi:hypothetical protein
MTVAALNPEAVLAPTAAGVEASFRERVSAAGVKADWATAMTAGDAALIREAVAAVQSSDLAILGQYDPERRSACRRSWRSRWCCTAAGRC